MGLTMSLAGQAPRSSTGGDWPGSRMTTAPHGSSMMQRRRRWRWVGIGAGLLALAWALFVQLDAWRARGELRLAQQDIAAGRLEAAHRRLTGLAARPGALDGAADYWLGVCEALGGRPDAALRAFARVPEGYRLRSSRRVPRGEGEPVARAAPRRRAAPRAGPGPGWPRPRPGARAAQPDLSDRGPIRRRQVPAPRQPGGGGGSDPRPQGAQQSRPESAALRGPEGGPGEGRPTGPGGRPGLARQGPTGHPGRPLGRGGRPG